MVSMRKRHRGNYCLLIELIQPTVLTPGKLGTYSIPAGWYVYSGSGGSSLEGRLRRHVSSHPKRLRWHIDYLLANPAAKLMEVIAFPGERRGECYLNLRIKGMRGARVLISGFGSSDCTARCQSHLVYFEERPDILRAVPAGRRWEGFQAKKVEGELLLL